MDNFARQLFARQLFIESGALAAADKANKPIRFVITLKAGARFYCADDGGIIFDGERKYASSGSRSWAILGFSRRWNANYMIPLAEIADMPAEEQAKALGHGIVHDLDHGTHRIWGSPSGNRAVKVERTGGRYY